MKRFIVIAALTVLAGALAIVVGPTLGTSPDVEARSNWKVIEFTGEPAVFGPFDFDGFPPTAVTSVQVHTTRGPATITSTVGDFFNDIIDGTTRSDPPQLAEHIVAAEVWEFANGDQIFVESRNFAFPRVEGDPSDPDDCDVFQPSDNFGLITGGTGRFENASGNIHLEIDAFCITDAFTQSVDIEGAIDGLVVVRK